MKNRNGNTSREFCAQAIKPMSAATALVSIVSGILLLASTSPARAGSGPEISTPGVFPPGSSPYGKSYAGWAAAWYQWAFSLPATAHPLFDTADCSAGQSGPVWFLGGKFCSFPAPPEGCNASLAVRSCTVPVGKALFFPIVNTEDSLIEESLGFGCSAPGTCAAADCLSTCAASVVTGVADLECDIDGKSVRNLDSYLVSSPLFQFTLAPHDNLLAAIGESAAPDGATSQAVTQGVYVMLTPLPAGVHTLHFHGRFTCSFCGNFSLDVTYHLTVQQSGMF